jgi:hypothetical protein
MRDRETSSLLRVWIFISSMIATLAIMALGMYYQYSETRVPVPIPTPTQQAPTPTPTADTTYDTYCRKQQNPSSRPVCADFCKRVDCRE